MSVDARDLKILPGSFTVGELLATLSVNYPECELRVVEMGTEPGGEVRDDRITLWRDARHMVVALTIE